MAGAVMARHLVGHYGVGHLVLVSRRGGAQRVPRSWWPS